MLFGKVDDAGTGVNDILHIPCRCGPDLVDLDSLIDAPWVSLARAC